MGDSRPEESTFTWKIEHFLAHEKELKSRLFMCAGATWGLEMTPYLKTDDEIEVSISLLKISSTIPKHDVFYRLCLKGKDGQNECLNCCYQIVTGNNTRGIVSCIINRDNLTGEMKSDLLPNGTLTVCCELTAKKMDENMNGVKPLPAKAMSHLTTLSEDFERFYRNDQTYDILLKSKKIEISAHRTILRARSPVFYKMLDCYEEKVIDFSETKPSVLRSMLSYIYSGIVPDLYWEKAVELYKVGHRYELLELRNTCVQFIILNLSKQNFLHVVLLEDKWEDYELRESINLFFISNSIIITRTDEWANFKKQKEKLAESLLKLLKTRKSYP